jgi:hypothetical protein
LNHSRFDGSNFWRKYTGGWEITEFTEFMNKYEEKVVVAIENKEL